MSIVRDAFRLLEEESMLAQAEIRIATTRKTLRRRRGKVAWKTIATGNILEMEERFRTIASAFGKEPTRSRGQYRITMSHPGYKCWFVVSVYIKITRPALADPGGAPGASPAEPSKETGLNKVV